MLPVPHTYIEAVLYGFVLGTSIIGMMCLFILALTPIMPNWYWEKIQAMIITFLEYGVMNRRHRGRIYIS